jgi:anti-sigma B factor antagonist
MSQPAADASSNFSFELETKQDLVIVHCRGRLAIESGNTLRDQVRKLIAKDGHVVLDLTHVTYCDSMGLGTLISLYVSSKSTGCRFELINLGPTLRKLFTIANVISLFESAAYPGFRLP